MKRMFCFASFGAAAIAVGSLVVIAQPTKDTKQPTKDTKITPPPGMTEDDMKACMEAGTPGKMHERLAKSVGNWEGTCSMWTAPGTEPTKSPTTTSYSTMFDGRFLRCEVSGNMGDYGPFNGFGLYGYDNVGQKFQSTWIDNCGTGMATGTGVLSSDGKTLTWTYTFNCPIQKKPVTMRQVETDTGPNTKTITAYGPDKEGKEFKMMEISYTRKGGAKETKTETK